MVIVSFTPCVCLCTPLCVSLQSVLSSPFLSFSLVYVRIQSTKCVFFFGVIRLGVWWYGKMCACFAPPVKLRFCVYAFVSRYC